MNDFFAWLDQSFFWTHVFIALAVFIGFAVVGTPLVYLVYLADKRVEK